MKTRLAFAAVVLCANLASSAPPVDKAKPDQAKIQTVVDAYVKAVKNGAADRDQLRPPFVELGETGLLKVLEIAAADADLKQTCFAVFANDGGMMKRGSTVRFTEPGLNALLAGIDGKNDKLRQLCVAEMSQRFIERDRLESVIDRLKRIVATDVVQDAEKGATKGVAKNKSPEEGADKELRELAKNQLTGIAFGLCSETIAPENLFGEIPDFALVVRIGEPAIPAIIRIKEAADKIISEMASNSENAFLRDVSIGLGGSGGDTAAERWLKRLSQSSELALAKIQNAAKRQK